MITDFIRFGDADGSTCTAKAKSWRAKLKTFQNSRNRRYVLNKCTDPSLQVHQAAHYIYIFMYILYIYVYSNNYVVLSGTALCLSLSLSHGHSSILLWFWRIWWLSPALSGSAVGDTYSGCHLPGRSQHRSALSCFLRSPGTQNAMTINIVDFPTGVRNQKATH